LLIRKKSYIARVNKKRNCEIDSPNPSGSQMKYMNISFPWSPSEAAMSNFNFRFFVQNMC